MLQTLAKKEYGRHSCNMDKALLCQLIIHTVFISTQLSCHNSFPKNIYIGSYIVFFFYKMFVLQHFILNPVSVFERMIQ
jgi:hypothetical protein